MSFKNFVVRLRSLLSASIESVVVARARGYSPVLMVSRALGALRLGPRGFVRKIVAFSRSRSESTAPVFSSGEVSAYEQWIAEARAMRVVISPGRRSRISIVMPTCNTPERFLTEVIASVEAQTHEDWELCIADDASDAPHVRAQLETARRRDPRIKVAFSSERGGIAKASNRALAMATGDYVALLDHDDTLAPDALAAVVAKAMETDADLVYTDHDYLGQDDRHHGPFFKPDWSPDLFLAQMYLGHLVVIRRQMIERVGPFRSERDGSQDYDMVLRCVLAGARIEHVPKVLYHWRQHGGSITANPGSKPYAHIAGQKAIQDYLDVASPGARADDGAYLFCYDVRYPLPEALPLVSIIIPTKDGLDVLSACVDSIIERTNYANYEIIVVDNGSVEPETLAWLAAIPGRDQRVRVMPAPVPFNWSHLNNLAAADAKGDVLVFLNNDTEVIGGDWLHRLAENSLREEVGICGPLLLYPDGTIQHAGVVVGLGGWADHVFKGLPPVHGQRLFVSPVLRRNVLAVTGACMAVAAETFRRLGGFDESFIVCGSDVELCLRAHRQGLRNLYLPETSLIHHESKTRDARDVPDVDFKRSAEEYGLFRTNGDPLYSPNLDPMSPVPTIKARP